MILPAAAQVARVDQIRPLKETFDLPGEHFHLIRRENSAHDQVTIFPIALTLDRTEWGRIRFQSSGHGWRSINRDNILTSYVMS